MRTEVDSVQPTAFPECVVFDLFNGVENRDAFESRESKPDNHSQPRIRVEMNQPRSLTLPEPTETYNRIRNGNKFHRTQNKPVDHCQSRIGRKGHCFQVPKVNERLVNNPLE
jgi:hypothetical protein